MASILRDEPDLSKVPERARHLLRRCLEKDPQKRLRHVGDVMSLLDVPPSGQYPASSSFATTTPSAERKWLWPAVGALAVVVAASPALWTLRRPPAAPTQAVRFEVGPNEKMTFIIGGAMTVSPDGHWLVFPAVGEDGMTRFWLRSLDTVEARALPGTEVAPVTPPAAWSFDSRYVLFSVSNKLKKVDIQGGPPQTLADLQLGGHNGASWNPDGTIVLGLTPNAVSPLLKVPAGGGAPSPVTSLAKGEFRHAFPQFLPDGRHFLYLRLSASDVTPSGVYVGSIDVKPEEQSLKRLLPTDRQAYYAAPIGGGPGHLIFLRESTLMAQPFDPATQELSGTPAPIAEGVASFAGANFALFTVSDTGTLVYRGGETQRSRLTWFDQSGNPTGTLGEPGEFRNPAVSPDGLRVAVSVGSTGSQDVWILDVTRGTSTRLTFDPRNDDFPVWSPDGRQIAFASNRDGAWKMYIKPADGSGEERLLTDRSGQPTGWSKDGRFLVFVSAPPQTAQDIWVLPDPANPSRQSKPFGSVVTPESDFFGVLSPDSRWLAYASVESGVPEVYVRPFSPGASGGAKWLVSKGGGFRPRWSADGKQLFYASAVPQLMVVDIDTSRGFQAGSPRRLFSGTSNALVAGWDQSPDSKRFLFVATPDAGRPAPFTVVLNWAAGLKK